jgi:ribonucleoside-diphosphate reductase alpha chain
MSAAEILADLYARTPNQFTSISYPNPSMEFAMSIICYGEKLNEIVDHGRDSLFDQFALRTLLRSYLIKDQDGNIVERPQHMWLRVSLGIHGAQNLDKVVESYNMMSLGYATHATPTLFNAGTKNSQCSSCFLLAMKDDSIDGIFNTVHDCARISKSAGGIGLHVHNVRASGAYIQGTGGTSNGLVPMLKVFNDTARYVDQGGGKRKGSFAIYLEPWHLDIREFLELRKNTGAEDVRARGEWFYYANAQRREAECSERSLSVRSCASLRFCS